MKVLAIFAMLWSFGQSYPSGPPTSVCESMTPRHAGSTAQMNMSSPFSIAFKSNANCYMAGQTYEVTLRSSENGSLFGFLVEARKANNKTYSYGIFNANGDPGMRTLDCFGVTASAISQNNTNDAHWTSKTFRWTAPYNTTETLEFVATVLRSFTTFWVGVKTDFPCCARENPTVSTTPTTPSTTSSSIRDATSSLPVLSLLIFVSFLLMATVRP